MDTRTRVAVSAALTLGLLAGCGDDDAAPAGPAAGEPGPTGHWRALVRRDDPGVAQRHHRRRWFPLPGTGDVSAGRRVDGEG